MQRALETGTSEEEIKDVIENGFEIPAKGQRLGKARIYRYDQDRLGTHYPEERIEVFYTVEADAIVTVTVYVFYAKWEDDPASTIR